MNMIQTRMTYLQPGLVGLEFEEAHLGPNHHSKHPMPFPPGLDWVALILPFEYSFPLDSHLQLVFFQVAYTWRRSMEIRGS